MIIYFVILFHRYFRDAKDVRGVQVHDVKDDHADHGVNGVNGVNCDHDVHVVHVLSNVHDVPDSNDAPEVNDANVNDDVLDEAINWHYEVAKPVECASLLPSSFDDLNDLNEILLVTILPSATVIVFPLQHQ